MSAPPYHYPLRTNSYERSVSIRISRISKKPNEKEPILFTITSLPETETIGKDVTYAKNQKPYMENYLLVGRCYISNNAAENAIRPVG